MDNDQRIAELEDTLKQRDRRIMELAAERDEALVLIAEQREHVEACSNQIDQWIEAFDMTLSDKGTWQWHDGIVQLYDALGVKYDALLAKWNAFVTEYNATVAPKKRNFGRPLSASTSQQAEVLKRRKAGESLRSIADVTGLSLRTVRTIIDKADGVDRATLARLAKIAPDRLAEAKERSRRKIRDALPRRITILRKQGDELLKAAMRRFR